MSVQWGAGPEAVSSHFVQPKLHSYVKVHASRPLDNNPSEYSPDFLGRHVFSQEDPAEFMVPYCAPTFVSMLLQAYYERFSHPGQMDINFENMTIWDTKVSFEIVLAVADDYHVGFFKGYKFNKPAFKPHAHFSQYPIEIYPVEGPKESQRVIKAHKQSGILDFIERAKETTIPIVEAASVLGSLLDAHPVTYPPTPMRMKQTGPEGPTDITQYTDRLLTTNHNGMNLPDEGAFGVDKVETNIQNLFTKTKSWIDTFNWKASDPVGTILKQYVAGPNMNGIHNSESLHDKLPLLWNYWTGSTIYQMEIMASGMHRGQLLCVYQVVRNSGVPKGPDFVDATQTYFTTIDLAQVKGTVSILLPYLSPIPYQSLGRNRNRIEEDPQTVGTLYIYVQNTLRGTESVANNVDIQVFKRYGHDFQVRVFGNMSDENRYPQNTAIKPQDWEKLETPSLPIPMEGSLDEEAFEKMLAISRSRKERARHAAA